MKAAICTKYGTPEVLQIQEVPKPIPKDNQILVKKVATAVNSGDIRVRSLDVKGFKKVMMRLVLGFSKPRKPILGTVFSGIVEQVGKKVSKFKIADELFGITGFKFGTYAEYIAVSEKSVTVKKPVNATFEEAAAILFGGQTAYYFLEKAKISEKFDIIFNAVGKITKKECAHLLTNGGIFKSVEGFEVASVESKQLLFLRDLFEKGKYKATIDKIYSIDKIIEAHRFVDTGRKKGNVVLRIAD